MPVAYLLVRREPHYRREAFEAGLRALGYQIGGEPRGMPTPADVLVIWNRYGRNHQTALNFERVGAAVIVVENGHLGRAWCGEQWYSLMLNNPAGAGHWPDLGPERWDSLGMQPCEWRKTGREIIVLAQRGIGPPNIRQPDHWHRETAAKLVRYGRVRIREHPGERPAKPLEDDLADALCCVTWASGAALKAIFMGVPVFYGYDKWIGALAALPLKHFTPQIPSYPDRTPMFRRLLWANWRIPEILTGQPIRALLDYRLRSTASGVTTARS